MLDDYATYKRLGVHASTTNREVLKALYAKLRPEVRGRTHRERRHQLARIILGHHAQWQMTATWIRR